MRHHPDGTIHETILLVDDDHAIRRVAQRVLELHGYDVVAVATGDEALRVLASANEDVPVDLLLTDLNMPGMGGVELARRIGEEQPALRVLFTSGAPPAIDVDAPWMDVAAHFIEKPYAISELARRVREVLDADPPAH